MTFRNDCKLFCLRLLGLRLGKPGKDVHQLARRLQAVLPGTQPQPQHGQGRFRLEEEPARQLRGGAESGNGLIIRGQQREEQILALLADIRNHQRRGLGPKQGHVDEIQHALRRVAVAVHDLVQKLVGVGLRADGGEIMHFVMALLRNDKGSKDVNI